METFLPIMHSNIHGDNLSTIHPHRCHLSMMPKHYNISMEAIKALIIPIEILYNTKALY